MNNKNARMFGFSFTIFLFLVLLTPRVSEAKEFFVNSTEDLSDADFPGVFDGVCETALGNGECTLRAAVQEANATSEKDTVILPKGEFILSGMSGEDNNGEGDLDILKSLTVQGAGARDSILKGGGNDRVIHIMNNIEVDLNDITIRDGVLTANNGAGVYNEGADLNVLRCTITENHNNAPLMGNGGGIAHVAGNLTIENSTIARNMVPDGSSGGLLIFSGNVAINNSTFSHNSAEEGEGAIDNFGTLSVSNSVIVFNEAGLIGGGTGGNLTLRNSILAKNTVLPNGERPDCNGLTILEGHNIIGDSTDCVLQNVSETDQIGTADNPIDPLLGPLQDNGGSTDTHALLEGSPAIDQGDNANCPATDQRGVARDDGNCDIGAYEANCGDNIKQDVEECDDGNAVDGDGCSGSCLLESGNGTDSSGGCSLTKSFEGGNFSVWVFMGILMALVGMRRMALRRK